MSDNIIEITENTNYSITIDTSLIQNDNNIVIELTNPNSIDVINNTTVLVSDLPQGYPLDWTVGNLPISRLSGLIGTSGINYSSGIISLSGIPTNLLPVQNLLAGSGIDIANNQGIFTVAVTGQFGLTGEQVDDRVSSLLVSGNYTTLNYDDENNKLTISVTGLQPSGNYSLAGHSHAVADVSGLQIILDNKQPSGIYASGIHHHTSNDITNFDNSVSGLLPVKNISAGSGISVVSNSGDVLVSVTGQFGLTSEQVDDRVNNLLKSGSYINLNYDDNLDSLTINVTGLQPSGNYSLVGHTHTISDVSGLQNALDNKQPSGIYASGVHSHVVSDITDFNTSVSGLVYGIYAPLNSPSFSGIPTVPTASSGTNTNQIASTSFVRNEISNLISSAPSTLDTLNELANALGNDPNFATTIASGLGQKSNIGHTHTSSEITNFSSSVSGLLPITNVVGGTNISISSTGSVYTVSVSGQLGLTGEQVDDRVNDLLKAGQYINLNYNDSLDSLTISVTGLQPSGNYANLSHTHPYTDISNFASGVGDSLTTTLLAGSFIELVYNSGLDTLIIGTSGLQPSGDYSIVGHTHTSSDITNFNSGVSGLLPTIANSGDNRILTSTGSAVGINAESNLTFNGSLLNITGSGVFSNNITASGFIRNGGTSSQFLKADGSVDSNSYYLNTNPSGYTSNNGTVTNVAALTIGTSGNDISSTVASGTTTPVITLNIPTASSSNRGVLSSTDWTTFNNKQPSGNYSLVGHSHIISDVSGLQNALDSKQPSGNYANTIHNHPSSDITDFNSSVSGLLPVKDISAGTGISITSNSGVYTINSTGSGILADQASSIVTTVFNKTGSIIPKMTAVYINGGQGDLPTISLAIATGDATSAGTYGLTYESISNMSSGKVIVFGALSGLNTDQFNPTAPQGDVNGQVVYLSPSVSGGLILNKPSAPNHIVALGTIVRTHQNEGVIEVRVQNGFELEELHNVAISGVTNGQFLQYNGSGLWIPSSSGNFSTLLVNGTGVSLNGHSHSSSSITDFNSSVSGLLPVTNILGGSNIGISQSGSVYTIAVTGSLGLTTEEVDDRISTLLVAGTGIDLSYNDNLNTLTITSVGSSASGNYALVGHTHTSSNITDFNSSVSGLLPVTNIVGGSNVSVSSSGSIYTVAVTGSLGLTTEEVDDRVSSLLVAGSGISLDYNDGSNTLTINTSGLQPSGNYSIVGHSHISTDITDFNSSVSGLLPVKTISAGSGTSILASSGNFTISVMENIINSSNLYLWANFR